MILSGADVVMECMLEQGVDTVFGYPGGSILHIYDSLYRYSHKLRHILTSHEEGAAHAADGYARSSGKCGVVFATSGPGATNLVTGIATAYMDSVPMVAITCNVTNSLLGKDSFQEVDIVGITMPITKHNFLVKKAEDIAPTIRRAFAIATAGRPGPVLVDITKNATAEETEFEPMCVQEPASKGIESSEKDIKAVLKLLGKARRPLIYAGGGVISANASEELKEFQTLLDAPVALSVMGLGGFDGDHPAYCGMIGMHGTKATALAVRDCDLLIAVGARFSDRVTCDAATFAQKAKILHFDADRAEVGKNIRADASLIGDAKAILSRLNRELTAQSHPKWNQQVAAWKKEYPLESVTKEGLTPRFILETLHTMTEGKAYVCTDVGQHQMWTAQFFGIRYPRHFISSGGLGTMGFGLGAAIGTQLAHPDAVVLNITGDGCFHMNMNELATASSYDLPIIEIVMNNRALGMVRQWQKMFYDKRFSYTSLEKKTDFPGVAKALGARGVTVTTREEFCRAIETALRERKIPTVVNCLIDPDELVLPMVPGGQSIDDAILVHKEEKV